MHQLWIKTQFSCYATRKRLARISPEYSFNVIRGPWVKVTSIKKGHIQTCWILKSLSSEPNCGQSHAVDIDSSSYLYAVEELVVDNGWALSLTCLKIMRRCSSAHKLNNIFCITLRLQQLGVQWNVGTCQVNLTHCITRGSCPSF